MAPSTDKEKVAFRAAADMDDEHAESKQSLLNPDLAGHKRKAPEKGPGRFKVVAQLVMAMQRFQGALNPTYSYGKRPSTSGSVDKKVSEAREVPAVNSPGSGDKAATGSSGAVYHDRGHKTAYLLRPLPELTVEGAQDGLKVD